MNPSYQMAEKISFETKKKSSLQKMPISKMLCRYVASRFAEYRGALTVTVNVTAR
jgi:hypothetical protein